MALLPGRDITPSTFLTEGSSTSTTTPTTLTDMSPKSLTMALLLSPLLSLVSAMALPTVVSSVMVWRATVSELPMEDVPTSVKPSVKVFKTKETQFKMTDNENIQTRYL